MEGWSKLRDGDVRVDECGFSECNFKLRSMFDEVLKAFLSEKSVETKCVRPIPVMGVDGQPVDLFKLFWVVRKIGGYDVVCKKNLWDSVKLQCGLGFGSVGSIRLIYDKYLNEFDEWLWKLYEQSSLEGEGGGICGKLDLFSKELKTMFRGLVSIGGEEKKTDSELGKMECDGSVKGTKLGNGENEGCMLAPGNVEVSQEKKADSEFGEMEGNRSVNETKLDNGENEGYMLALGNVEVSQKSLQLSVIDDNSGKLFTESGNELVLSATSVLDRIISQADEASTEGGFSAGNDEPVVVSAKTVGEDVLDSRKRKRENISSAAVVNWVKNLAVKVGDLSLQKLPEFSKWRKEALLVRKACLIRRSIDSTAEAASQQKKQRMNPSMYEDDKLNDSLTERSRARRKVTAARFHLCSCSNSCSTTCQKAECGSAEEPEENKKSDSSTDDDEEGEISVGPEFQAEVPAWTGIPTDSDPKWLGTRMWPPEDEKHETMMKLVPVGRGRESFCECPFPASVECVRFHIAEKRLQLKVEIGSVFYKWKFDRMGEEVSLSWTTEDEEKFKNMMRLNVATRNKFWTNAFKFFPYKTRQTLVSYYFNVFLIQRRSFQNRVMPKDVDSDDEDKAVGSIGELFGYKALRFPGSDSQTCAQNKQCYIEE